MSTPDCPPPCPNPMERFSARFANEGCEPALPGCITDVMEPPCPPTNCGDEYDDAAVDTAATQLTVGRSPSDALRSFNHADESKHLRLTFPVGFEFSLASAAANPALATWKMNAGIAEALKKGVANADVTKAVLLEVVIEEVRATGPDISLGFLVEISRSSGARLPLKSNIVTGSGNPVSYAIMARSNPVSIKHCIHKAGNELASAQMQHLGLTEEKLRAPLMVYPDEEYTLVPINNTIAEAVVKNADNLNLNITRKHIMDGRLKIGNDLVETMIGAILDVANNLPTVSLSSLTVTAVRMDGEDMGSPTHVDVRGQNQVVRDSYRTDTIACEAFVTLVYMFV